MPLQMAKLKTSRDNCMKDPRLPVNVLTRMSTFRFFLITEPKSFLLASNRFEMMYRQIKLKNHSLRKQHCITNPCLPEK